MSKSPPDSGGSIESRIAKLERALADALARAAAAEAKVADQQARLEALGQGREDTMRALAEARSALRQMTIERDEAKKQLERLEGLQTATITLPDDASIGAAPPKALPSIEELMAGLGDMAERPRSTVGHRYAQVHAPSDGERTADMLSPEIVFPEEYARAEGPAADATTSRVLVLLDGERPIKFPIYKESMTIGRAENADIQVPSNYISRIHARLTSTAAGVTIEDIGSKNGIKVNAKLAPRHTLTHGDVIGIGPIRFRFLDTSVED